HGGTPERQLLPRGQEFPQRLQAAGDEKILVGIGPAGEDVIRADSLARGEVDYHNASGKCLALLPPELGQARTQKIQCPLEEFALGVEYAETHVLQPG